MEMGTGDGLRASGASVTCEATAGGSDSTGAFSFLVEQAVMNKHIARIKPIYIIFFNVVFLR